MTDPLQHLRPIDLERLSVGEVVVGADHVERCPECAATVQTLKLEARAFTQRRPAAVVVERVRAQRPGPWWSRWWPALAVPLAALLVFVISSGRPDEVRLKGGGFSTLLNGDVLLSAGVPVRAGDHLSFIVETQRPAQVLVLDLEAGKPVTAFVPFEGRGSVAVPKGRTALPDGATLDDSPAPEWLVALVCEDAVTLEMLALPTVVTRAPPVVAHPGCQVQVVELTRSPR